MIETQGQRIRRVRDEKGVKQNHISRITGITQAHLSRIENDESGVTKNTLRKIAEALDVHYDILYVPKQEITYVANNEPVTIDDAIGNETALARFLGGQRLDDSTIDWVRRTLVVMREEVRRRKV